MTDLTTLTPVEVDTPLAELYERIYDLQYTLAKAIRNAKHYEEGVEARERGDFRYSSYTRDTLDKYLADADGIRADIRAVVAETKPFEAEFMRRGGWTRAWLVDNSNGHVHNTMDCSTCFPTTRFGWLPQVSGFMEEEIVALAGEGACTICYPSAPAEVLNNPNALELPRRREERLAREAEAAKRLAAKTEKSLSVDGSIVELRWDSGRTFRGYKELKTYRAAELWVVGALAGTDYDNPTDEVVAHVIHLMALKRGVTMDEIRAGLAKRVEKKRAKGY